MGNQVNERRIKKLSNARIKGFSLLNTINKGEQPKTTTQSKEEIQAAIKYKENQIADIVRKRENLDFDRMMIECDEGKEEAERRIIAVALGQCIKNKDNNLGVYTIEWMQNLLRKIELKPYCERLGKRYDELT